MPVDVVDPNLTNEDNEAQKNQRYLCAFIPPAGDRPNIYVSIFFFFFLLLGNIVFIKYVLNTCFLRRWFTKTISPQNSSISVISNGLFCSLTISVAECS